MTDVELTDATVAPSASIEQIDRRHPCHRIARAFFDTPWAILPSKAEALAAFIEARAINGTAVDFPESAAKPTGTINAAIGVIPVHGTISHRANMLANMSGGTSTERLGAEIDSMASNPNVTHIVLDIDSPGGSVSGVAEVADKVRAAARLKPVTAVANAMAASASYWIGSQASEMVVTPSGIVGSIGVLSMHQDLSRAADIEGITTTFIHAGKYKTEGNEFEPLGDEARSAMQALVDSYYGDFVNAVAKGRKVNVDVVREGFGQGRIVRAKPALAAGMVDRIASFDDVMDGLLSAYRKRKSRERMAEIERSKLALARARL